MGKWLALAALAVLALALVVLRQLGQPGLEAEAAPVRVRPAEVVLAPVAAPAARIVVAAPAAAPAAEVPARIDVQSDAFFYTFQEVVPKVLSRNAARCYEGIATRVHRNQKLVLAFKTRIAAGVVTVRDVVITTSTLDNPALEACFLQEVQRSTWTDPALPDWEADDELVIRPERGLKKYLRASQDDAP